MPTISQGLGAFVAGTRFADIPGAVSDAARLCLLHDLIIALAGRPHEKTIQQFAAVNWRAPAQAILLSSGQRISAEGAAFANAALMNVRSQDDTHEPSVSHPGVPTICAALAAAEMEDASGAKLLEAIVLGYEVIGRIGRIASPQMNARRFRPAAVLGVFGATAAAARVFALSAEQTAHALGLATQMAAGHGQVWMEGGSEFTTQLGLAARNGLVAAQLARAGTTAVPHAFEGVSGFYRAFAGMEVATTQILAGLGREWALPDVTVKMFPVCAALQGPVHLTREMLSGLMIGLENVREVHLTLNPFEADFNGVDNAGDIATPAAAKMSAQFCLALAIRDRTVTFDALTQVNDPQIRAHARKIQVGRDKTLNQRQCRLTIALDDGRILKGRIDTPVGKPDEAAIIENARSMGAETGMSAHELERLASAVRDLSGAGDLSGLLRAWPVQPKTAPARGLN